MKNPPRRDIMKNMEQIKKNDIFEARIEGYNSEGSGVARILGRAVFVPRTIAGEVWCIVIVKVTSSAVYGRAYRAFRRAPRAEVRELSSLRRVQPVAHEL